MENESGHSKNLVGSHVTLLSLFLSSFGHFRAALKSMEKGGGHSQHPCVPGLLCEALAGGEG